MKIKSSTLALSLVAALPVLLSGCESILGESFVLQDMRDPKTGAAVVCVGHVGRGEPSKAELDTMNACVSWYLSQGYVKVD